MNELEQWCEIDGHDWVTGYQAMGLVNGPQTQWFYKHCRLCQKDETVVVVPAESEYKRRWLW